ncbi:MAG: hypothetical protein SFY68_08730 [Candidatus Sumerlaeia bacterium]|nr:hypothetical protein [Candidatus Sumerlaeia bacterium]
MGKVVLHTPPPLNVDDLYHLIHLEDAWVGDWREFTSVDQERLLDSLLEAPAFSVEKTTEHFGIPVLTFGNPKGRRVLIWVRQHGDEPECTAALNSVLWILFNRLENAVVASLLHHLYFCVVPLVNKGALDAFTRQTPLGFDANRDARAKAIPEGQLLTKLRAEFKPEFAFSMHDMNPRKDRESGRADLVSLAFQAAPYNEFNSDNLTRLKSKTIIGFIVDHISPYAPSLARYNSAYLPRGFGDASMNDGVSCILIESGSLKDDDGGDEEVARLHALALLLALYGIAHDHDQALEGSSYEALPLEAGVFDFDVLLRHAEIADGDTLLKGDVGIQTHLLEDHVSHDRQFRSEIVIHGDLGKEQGIYEPELHDCVLRPGLVNILTENPFPNALPSEDDAARLLRLGITTLALPVSPNSGVERSKLYPAPTLNIVPFEQVQSFEEIIARHGGTEYKGFAVQGVWPGQLRSLWSTEWKDASTEDFTGTLFFTVGRSPRERSAWLQESSAPAKVRFTLQDVEHFVNSFALKQGSCVYSPGFKDSSVTPSVPVGINTAEFLSSIKPEHLPGLHRNSSRFLQHFHINKLGTLRFKSQADIIAYPRINEELRVFPTTVLLNGTLVIHEFTRTPARSRGRYFFADHE